MNTDDIADGNVTKSKLSTDIQTSLGKADNSLKIGVNTTHENIRLTKDGGESTWTTQDVTLSPSGYILLGSEPSGATILSNEDQRLTFFSASTTYGEIKVNSNNKLQITGLDTPTSDTDAANKGYVDSKVSDLVQPVIFDASEFPTAPDAPSSELIAKLLNCVTTGAPAYIWGNIPNSTGGTNKELCPLSVRMMSTLDRTFRGGTIKWIASDAIMHSMTLLPGASMASTKHISPQASVYNPTSEYADYSVQSSAIWSEIHAEKIHVDSINSDASKTLEQSSEHKILITGNAGTHTFVLPSTPLTGETFAFIKTRAGSKVTLQANSLWVCTSGTSSVVSSYTTPAQQCGKITATWTSSDARWYIIID